MTDNDLHAAAVKTLRECMAVRAGEVVTDVADTATREVAEALVAAAHELGAEAVLALMTPRRINGEEPPAPVAALMRDSDVLLLATAVSLSHTDARKQANAAGTRAASLPGVTADMMVRTMAVDYVQVAARSRKLADGLKGVRRFHLTSAAGTDLTLNVEDVAFGADVGLYAEPGAFGNLPAGEVCGGPRLAGSSGVAVFDGSFAGVGLLRTPIRVTFHDGLATDIEGGAEARALAELLAPFGDPGKTLAEIGIGTHPTARLTGVVLEDEKIAGTVHLALGNNVGFGGENAANVHLDGVILSPTLTTDAGVVWLDNGVPRF